MNHKIDFQILSYNLNVGDRLILEQRIYTAFPYRAYTYKITDNSIIEKETEDEVYFQFTKTGTYTLPITREALPYRRAPNQAEFILTIVVI